MKKYVVEVSKTAKQDLNKVILYLRNELLEDIIADKYRILLSKK